MNDKIIIRKNSVKYKGHIFHIRDLSSKLFHIPNTEKLSEFPPGLLWISTDNQKYLFHGKRRNVVLVNEDIEEVVSFKLHYQQIYYFDVTQSKCEIFYCPYFNFDNTGSDLKKPYFRNSFSFKGDFNYLIKNYGTGADFFDRLLFDFVFIDDYIEEKKREYIDLSPPMTLQDLVDQHRPEIKDIFDYAEEMYNDSQYN